MSAMERAPADPPVLITFSAFSLDLRAGRLTRDGEPVPLRPKTWAVLHYLVERPGALVTKNALLEALWPDVSVSEDTLNKSIGELRVALGDEVKNPRFIETVHRRGFRFVAQARREQVLGVDVPVESGAIDGRTEPFVGRTDEIGRLAALFAKACAGERQVVFITGSAGIGKTALVEAFLGSLSLIETGMPVWVARGLCIQHHGPSREPYMPVLDALDRVARRADAGHVGRLLRQLAPTWLAQMPWLSAGDDAATAAPHSPRITGPERMLREFAAFAEALTAAGTLVLVLEDLHWSDPSTVDLLSVLAQRKGPARLLVIGTYRPAEIAVQEHVLSRVVRTLQLHRQCVQIPVHELSARDVRRYLEMRFPGASFSVDLARLIHEHTDGNPLFVVAIVDYMLSHGWILETAPGWALSTPLATLTLGVPDDVRQVIETQFEGMRPAQRSVLEATSLGAKGLTAPVIAAALGFETEDVELHLETLVRTHRFLRVADRAALPGGAVAPHYTFAHELYRQVLYEGLPDGRRRRLHQRLGEALETAYGERATEIAHELGVHFERGRDPTRAVRYLTVAAARARQRLANREAVGYLETALDLAALLPNEEDKRCRELELRVALAQPLHELHGFASERVRENSERAYALSTAVGNPVQVFAIVYSLWFLHATRGDAAATVMAAKLDDLAQGLGTADYRLEADSILLRTATYEGRFTEARRIGERRLMAKRRPAAVPVRAVYGADPVIAAQCHYAHALWFLGHPDRAQVTMRASLARAEASGSPFTLAAALGHAGLLEAFCRNPAALGDLAERMAALSAEHGFAFWLAMASVLSGRAEAQRGRVREGIATIERGLAAYREIGARMACSYFLAFLAEARGSAGALTDGLAAVDEGLVLTETTLDRGYEPELRRLKGELLLVSQPSAPRRPGRGGRAGRPAAAVGNARWQEAERCLLRALESARAAQAKSLELRAATSLAHAWQRRGRAAEARALLAGVCDWFGAGPGNADLVEARRLLDTLV